MNQLVNSSIVAILTVLVTEHQNITKLKRQCHEIFDLQFFFHQTIPARSLIHALKYFILVFNLGPMRNRLTQKPRVQNLVTLPL
jgi:hypothetical protein